MPGKRQREPLNDEAKAHIYSSLTTMVRGGFEEDDRIREAVDDLVYAELGHHDEEVTRPLLARVDEMLAEQKQREKTWSEPTVNDSLDLAFAELNATGIVALQNAGYTMSDGWSDANEIAAATAPAPRGAVFYHGQDLERGVAGEGLLLAFGAYVEGRGHVEASLAIAREVCAVLERHDVPVEWSGSLKERIHILPFEWRRRRG